MSIGGYSFLAILRGMGFKENLKSELIYTGMLVKELAAETGIKKHTLDNYLNTHNSLPNAEAAVKIARALGVTVEYLVTGSEGKPGKYHPPLVPDLALLVEIAEKLSKRGRRLAAALLRVLAEQDREEV
jgi:transcriptional regulator with XRE-family HTH domain